MNDIDPICGLVKETEHVTEGTMKCPCGKTVKAHTDAVGDRYTMPCKCGKAWVWDIDSRGWIELHCWRNLHKGKPMPATYSRRDEA